MSVERELQQRTSGRRYHELDALRGLAAAVVVVYHFNSAYPRFLPPAAFPFRFGTQSVVLFFVLSGYVLSLPVWRGKQPSYGPYLLRRLFRIWVPYAAATIVAAACALKFGGHVVPGVSPWFYRTWQEPMTVRLVLQQLFTMPKLATINTAFWSLRYEAGLSIALPFVAVLIRRLPSLVILPGVGAALGWISYVLLRWDEDSTFAQLHFSFLWYLCFVLGILLALHEDRLQRLYTGSPRFFHVLLAAVTVALYFNTASMVLSVLGACGAVILARYSSASRLLRTAPCEYLGRISYSMYLVHGTILFSLLVLGAGRVSTGMLFLIYLALVWPVSHVFCVLVEEPALRLGRRLTKQRTDRPGMEEGSPGWNAEKATAGIL